MSGFGLNDASGAAISGRGRNYVGGRLTKPADRDHRIQTEVLNIENRVRFVVFSYNGHTVLKLRVVPAGTTDERT